MTSLTRAVDASHAAQAEVQVSLGGDLLHNRGDLAGARACFARAYDLAERAGEWGLMAAAALGEGGLWVHERRSAADAAQVAARQRLALARVDPASSLGLRLRVRLAAEDAYRSEDRGAVMAFVDRARGLGDPVVLADALSLAHHCMLGPQHARGRLPLAEELLRVGSRSKRRSDVLLGLLWRTVDLFLCADLHAERSYAELMSAEQANPSAAVNYVIMAMDVMLSIRAGRLAHAEEAALACRLHGDSVGDQDAIGWNGAQLFAIRWYQGRAGEMDESATKLAGSPTLSEMDNAFVAAQAVAAAVAGDLRRARGALGRICGRDLGDLPRSSSWLVALCGVVEAAALLDEPAPAGRAYELLLPFRHLPAMGSLAVVCFGSVEQALGVASLAVGETVRAVEHLRSAVLRNEALGHWPGATLSKARLGQALAMRGEAGDIQAGERLYAEAAAEAAGSGMALPPAAPPAASGPRRARAATCVRRGRQWRIELDGRWATVDDSVGLRHLAALIANPGVDIPAVELVQSDGSQRWGSARAPQHVLDDAALRQYRARLQGLHEQIEEAEALGAVDRLARLRSEADWLVDELRAQTGLGGRSRAFAGESERARICVGKAIRRALQRLAVVDPIIGAQLRDGVRTGMVCCYQPAPDPSDWGRRSSSDLATWQSRRTIAPAGPPRRDSPS